MQLLIPYAFVNTPGCAEALDALQLPRLDQLLRRLSLVRVDAGSQHDLSPPHERALAQALGITATDGLIPWAALELTRAGRRPGPAHWAWITPAHWQIGAGGIQMRDPLSLQLQEAESQALLKAMAPYFAQDGLELEFVSGPPLTNLACASLDRVLGTDVSPWMPTTAAVRRLQNEMQMLLYTHPVNDARAFRALEPVNSFWISGNGVLDDAGAPSATPQVTDALRLPALIGDWASWAGAWQSIDQQSCPQLLAALDAGDAVELVLCSDRNALHFASRPIGWRERLQRRWRSTTLKDFTGQL
jgi:hypothetical protein